MKSHRLEDQINTFKLQEQFNNYLVNWKLFVVILIITTTTGLLYLHYTPVSYNIGASILIKDSQQGVLSEYSAFDKIDLLRNNNKNIENEIEIFKSKNIHRNVVQSLNLDAKYFLKSKLTKRWIELDQNIPFTVRYNCGVPVQNSSSFFITILSNKMYGFKKNEEDTIQRQQDFGKEFMTNDGTSVLIISNDSINLSIGRDYQYVRSPIGQAIRAYQGGFSVGLANKDASVIALRMVSQFPNRAKAYIDQIIEEYNMDAINDKTHIAKNTSDFITERLSILDDELKSVEDGITEFLTTNKLTDLESETEMFLKTSFQNSKNFLEYTTQMTIVKSMLTYIQKPESVLLPTNMGLSDRVISENVNKYNQQLIEKNELEASSSAKNPVLILKENRLKATKEVLLQSMKNLETTTGLQLSKLNAERAKLQSKLKKIPQRKNKYHDILRKQKIKEELFIYLLTKREETVIAMESTAPSSKTISYTDVLSVRGPKPKRIWISVFVVTLLFFFLIIFFKELFNIKIKDTKEIKLLCDVPLAGEIAFMSLTPKTDTTYYKNGVFRESFRILESNIRFMLTNVEGSNAKKITITSTIAGEGKSFTAVHLANTMAASGKKVALLCFDWYAPKFQEYYSFKSNLGLTNYIEDNSLSISDICETFEETPGLSVFKSGPLPPNPAAIVQSKRARKIIETLQETNDYIIIDTPPIGAIADALLLSQVSDLCLFITRQNYSDKRSLAIPQEFFEQKRFSTMGIVLNAVKKEKGRQYYYYR